MKNLLTHGEDNSLLLLGCIRTLGNLQNEIYRYVQNIVDPNSQREKLKTKPIRIQDIRPEHLLKLNESIISTKFHEDAVVPNYEYGKSKDILYDFEEIEIMLKNKVGEICELDLDTMTYFNYQFELYNQEASLINNIRRRIKQVKLSNDDKRNYSIILSEMENDELCNYLGSLDYVFTYLAKIVTENGLKTIQKFVQQTIPYSSTLDSNVIREKSFCNVQLKYIISLYELIEQIVFDKVIKNHLAQILSKETFTDEERVFVVKQFLQATIQNERVPEAIQDPDIWIIVLKRLIVRVTATNAHLDVPLQLYIQRTDFWNEDISESDLETININEKVELKHSYVILLSLEDKYRRQSTHTTVAQINVTLVNTCATAQEQATIMRSYGNSNIASNTMITGGTQSRKPTKFR
ncbi:unnamed protein product [Didymodactylos carnosus]|uniref:Uncharacterized protein n=1 Tax=Didymodactylos carnosus TaxID=1234261 RepID=A0A8S2EWV0_9BILA|nr:unnamed protein product [Didymodactylos carnosus]CAF4071409.1 unnamed protein product [Didymodactylos carnosus]